MLKTKITLLDDEIIKEYDFNKTRIMVRNHFSLYRSYSTKVEFISLRYNSPLGTDNMGSYSSLISDPTGNRVEQIERMNDYLIEMRDSFKILLMKLTNEEKIIFNMSILASNTDEDVAEALNIDKSNIYKRKKSCYIKVAIYYGLEVFK